MLLQKAEARGAKAMVCWGVLRYYGRLDAMILEVLSELVESVVL